MRGASQRPIHCISGFFPSLRRCFDLTTSITHPDATGYADPAIGARPIVTTPPLFVGGVKQN